MAGSSLNTRFYRQIVDLLKSARHNVVRAVNHTMVLTYHEVGRMIVDEEQNGKERAEYGKRIIKELSKRLTKEFGRGYSERNIEQMRLFYLTYSIPQTVSAESKRAKPQTLSAEINSGTVARKLTVGKMLPNIAIFGLSWSHYLILIRIDNNGKSAQNDPLNPAETDPRFPFQTDPLFPAETDPLTER